MLISEFTVNGVPQNNPLTGALKKLIPSLGNRYPRLRIGTLETVVVACTYCFDVDEIDMRNLYISCNAYCLCMGMLKSPCSYLRAISRSSRYKATEMLISEIQQLAFNLIEIDVIQLCQNFSLVP